MEWGTCDASESGDGVVDVASTQLEEWLLFLDEHGLSHAGWCISDKLEAAATLHPRACTEGGWEQEDLTNSGKLMRAAVRGDPIDIAAIAKLTATHGRSTYRPLCISK